MKKKLVVVMLFFTLACQTVLGAPAVAPVAMSTDTAVTILPTSAPTAPEEAQLPPTLPPTLAPASGFEEIRLNSKDGALNVQLEEQAHFAAASGLMPIVEFDASW